jgi:hypothetical protein
MKPTPTDSSKVFPCCLPPTNDGQGNVSGGILYPASQREGRDTDPSFALMTLVMHVSVRVGAKHPPLVEVEA